MISSMASNCQDFEIRGLQLHYVNQLKKTGIPNLRSCHFAISWPNLNHKPLSQKNWILKSWWEWESSLSHSCPVEHRQFTSWPPMSNILSFDPECIYLRDPQSSLVEIPLSYPIHKLFKKIFLLNKFAYINVHIVQ